MREQNLRQDRVRPLAHFRLRQAKRDVSRRRDGDPVGDIVCALVFARLGLARKNGDGYQQGGDPRRGSRQHKTARYQASEHMAHDMHIEWLRNDAARA